MLSGRAVNKVGLKNMFESLWQNKTSVKIEDYMEGIAIFTFAQKQSRIEFSKDNHGALMVTI